MRITQLEQQARHPDRYNLYLDGTFVLGLSEAAVVAEDLHVGDEVSASDLERLRAGEADRGLFDAALRFLAPRPRSRAEVRRRLLTPGPHKPAPGADDVERVLDRLEELELLSDRDFAAFWVENRERFSPRSARALGQELRQRGVARDTVDEVSQPERDEERAVEAGRQRLRALGSADYATFRTRMGQFLLRRGFGYGVARDAIRALWEETRGAAAGDDSHDEDQTEDD
jgi:regulatory protein